jgi:hypothetical protein
MFHDMACSCTFIFLSLGAMQSLPGLLRDSPWSQPQWPLNSKSPRMRSGEISARLLPRETPPLIATLPCALVILISTAVATPRLLRQTGHQHGPLFEIPRGIVVILAGLTAITFLVEGAMLDWSALLLTSKEIVESDRAGFGYVLFAIAMTTGRLRSGC